MQEDSIRTDDLLERIQESGPSRHSSAASEPDSTELLRPGESAAAQSRRRKSADPSTLKRAREAAVQSQPLALRLDVLAGPGMEQAAFQSDVGATEVCRVRPPAQQLHGGCLFWSEIMRL